MWDKEILDSTENPLDDSLKMPFNPVYWPLKFHRHFFKTFKDSSFQIHLEILRLTQSHSTYQLFFPMETKVSVFAVLLSILVMGREDQFKQANLSFCSLRWCIRSGRMLHWAPEVILIEPRGECNMTHFHVLQSWFLGINHGSNKRSHYLCYYTVPTVTGISFPRKGLFPPQIFTVCITGNCISPVWLGENPTVLETQSSIFGLGVWALKFRCIIQMLRVELL